MAFAVRDLINASLMDIGALAAGETATASELTDAFNALNNLVDSWSNDQLFIFSKVIENFPLVSGQQTYTMGIPISPATADFNTAWPQSIEAVGIILSGATYPVEIPVLIITYEEWQMIGVKTVTSSIPLKMYSDRAFPLTNLNFWPIPEGGGSTINIYSWKQIADFASVSTTLSLPPGYNRALQKGLAIELCPMFGKTPGAALVDSAKKSLAAIKRMNTRPLYLVCDDALLAERPGFNWMTGDTNK